VSICESWRVGRLSCLFLYVCVCVRAFVCVCVCVREWVICRVCVSDSIPVWCVQPIPLGVKFSKALSKLKAESSKVSFATFQ